MYMKDVPFSLADSDKYPFTFSVGRNMNYNSNKQKKLVGAFMLGLRQCLFYNELDSCLNT